jgi:hypothetical protein
VMLRHMRFRIRPVTKRRTLLSESAAFFPIWHPLEAV